MAGLTNTAASVQERELVCEGWGARYLCAAPSGGRSSGHHHHREYARNGDLAYRVELPVNEALTRQARVSVFGRFAAVAEISGTRAATCLTNRPSLQVWGPMTATLPQPQPNKAGNRCRSLRLPNRSRNRRQPIEGAWHVRQGGRDPALLWDCKSHRVRRVSSGAAQGQDLKNCLQRRLRSSGIQVLLDHSGKPIA